MVNLGEDIEQLYEDQTRECDANYVHERVIKPGYRKQHDCSSLEDRDPYPGQEGLEVERSSFLQRLVEWWEFHHGLSINISVNYE